MGLTPAGKNFNPCFCFLFFHGPNVTNDYFNHLSFYAILVGLNGPSPLLTSHIIGKLLKDFGYSYFILKE